MVPNEKGAGRAGERFGRTGTSAGRGIMRVLLVEDDHAIVRALTDLLEGEGFTVRSCATQDGACAALAAEDFDIALLDVTLAQGNGFAVCAAAREAAPEMPVIFLTASDDEYSTVAGLDMGAVDYIAKPFRARELVSRIRGALRRTTPAANVLTVGDVRLDVASAAVTKAGREVFLSALEYRLLLYFFQHICPIRTSVRPRQLYAALRMPFGRQIRCSHFYLYGHIFTEV